MRICFLIVFWIATAIHLYASAKKDTGKRNISKPLILLSLLGFYVMTASAPTTAVILALLFSWLGDVLLIPKGVKFFTAGGIAFMFSHVFFILAYLKDITISAIPVLLVIALSVFFLITVSWVFSKLKTYLPKALFYPMFLYLLINGAMNCFAIFRFVSVPTAMTVTTVIGAILFFISDATLFFVRFKKDGRIKTHFWVMLTYSVGEFLIVLGLL